MSRVAVCYLLVGGIYIFGRGIFLISINMFSYLCYFILYLVFCMACRDLMKVEFHNMTDHFFPYIFSHLSVASVVVLWLFCFILHDICF